MTLPPYNQDATCPKCGGATRVSGWMPSRRAKIKALAGEWPHEPGKVVWLPEGAPDEHIVRTCERCGYAWPEAPMDAEPGVPFTD